MRTIKYIRNSLLTGVCVGLLAGCSWLEDWPPKNSELARKTAPKPPESKIMKTSGGTWLEGNGEEPVEVTAEAATEPKGLAVDEASADRISQLENNVAQLSNELKMIMPALTKLASAQNGQMQNGQAMSAVEPAAGGAMAQGYVQEPALADGGMPKPGTVAWYEMQEQQNRAYKNNALAQNSYQQAAAPQPLAQQQAYQPPPQQAAPQQPQYARAEYFTQGGQPPAVNPPMQQQAYNQNYGGQQPAPAYNQQAYNQQPSPQQQVASVYGSAPAPQQQAYQPPVQQQQASMQQASYGGNSYGASVTNVRFGEHPDKTRVVLDTSEKVAFSYDLNNNENILVINLPGIGWGSAPQMQVSNSPLVDSYSVVPDNQGGSQVLMQLKAPARVLWSQSLAPGGSQGNRVVFDIAAR